MTQARISVASFEAATVLILLTVALQPAFAVAVASLVPLLHGLFLLGSFVLAHHFLRLWHRVAGHLLFTLVALVLVTEIIVHHYTTLHLNRFVLSLLAQPQALEQIGLTWTPVLLLLASLAGLIIAAQYYHKSFLLAGKSVLAGTLTALALSQGLYAFFLYQRDMSLPDIQRHLVFFSGLHAYHAEGLFSPILGPRPANPFAYSYKDKTASQAGSPAWEIEEPRNILLIVVDSMRAKDIRENPQIAPNLLNWGQSGFVSLQHSSVSNCTHFGMHTLFTGELPTTFAGARHGTTSVGVFAALAENGYSLTSAEAQSLDWYDIAHTYLPNTVRKVSGSQDAAARDQFVAEQTISILNEKQSRPWAHLAYFSGPHFFYDYNEPVTITGYQEKIRETDALIGQMLDQLKTSGTLENALVIITSDHGEQLPGEGAVGHGSILNDAQTTVPLVILGANTPSNWIRGHQDILPFIKTELGAAPRGAKPQSVQILAGCDYEFPNSFAVISDGERIDFSFEDGLLWPVSPATGVKQAPDKIRDAGMLLIDLLKEPQARP